MYPYLTAGDLGFRTLGCGGLRGKSYLYGTSSDCSAVVND
jgi:hypothetical protein